MSETDSEDSEDSATDVNSGGKTGERRRPPLLYIRGPEMEWVVVFESKSERDAWYTSIIQVMPLQTKTREAAAHGQRIGSLSYTFQNKDSYSGQWENGWMHGYGYFRRLDNWIFDGHWNSKFRAGYGRVHNPKEEAPYKCGWKETNGQIKVTDVYGLWRLGGLTDRDWRVMLSGAQRIHVPANDKIIQASKWYPSLHLYKVHSGRLRIQKSVDLGTKNAKEIITYADAPTVIGDMSMVVGHEPADIYAESDVDMVMVSISSLVDLFHTDPGICTRFYQTLSKYFADQLMGLHFDTTSPSTPTSSRSMPSVVSAVVSSLASSGGSPSKRQHEQQQKPLIRRRTISTPLAVDLETPVDQLRIKLQLHSTESLIDGVDCVLKAVLRKFGRLYLFQNYLCFESSVFGMTQTERIPLHKVSSVTVKNGSLRVEVRGGKKFQFFQIQNVDDFYQVLTNLWNESTKRKTNSSLLPTPPQLKTRRIPKRGSPAPKLTKEDWDLILAGATLRDYQPGEVIIKEGAENENIYQIAKGNCSVTKKGADGRGDIILGNLNPGTLFGELTFLQHETEASASVVAHSSVSCYVVPGHVINILFVHHPPVASRFYSYLASLLEGRVREREKKALLSNVVNLVDQHKSKRRTHPLNKRGREDGDPT